VGEASSRRVEGISLIFRSESRERQTGKEGEHKRMGKRKLSYEGDLRIRKEKSKKAWRRKQENVF